MYESHFGFSAAPFGLNPDPAFFFGSRGHTHALSYLKFGVYQGEGFVVVTGDVGAGKTTLVRTLLSELDSRHVVAAQIVSTQLEAGDLLRSVALAFGIAPKTLSKAELIATIEAFLMQLVTEKRRALLIVDEAQNLDRDAVEELRMLSNFQLGNQALIQSFLVGQPELRTLLTSKPMEQFRQRVIASCHLGPMDTAETRAYIEHRLNQVGWKHVPSFDFDAFARIHHWTQGIPRRVNLLCNRLLLSAYLENMSFVDAQRVDAVGREVVTELGVPQRAEEAAPAAVVAPGVAAAATPNPSPSPRRAGAKAPAPGAADPMLCISTSLREDALWEQLLAALRSQPAAPDLVLVRIGEARTLNPASVDPDDNTAAVLDMPLRDTVATERIADALKAFAPAILAHRPGCVAVIGSSDTALACALVANKAGVPLAHLDAGSRGRSATVEQVTNSMLIDRLSDVFYACEMSAYLNLIREGVDEGDVAQVGPLGDAQASAKAAIHLAAWWSAHCSPAR